jgi:prepilin-type N-terminal cleavage/methylation domain-containing protein
MSFGMFARMHNSVKSARRKVAAGAFTLIELLVVIAIIAILAALLPAEPSAPCLWRAARRPQPHG